MILKHRTRRRTLRRYVFSGRGISPSVTLVELCFINEIKQNNIEWDYEYIFSRSIKYCGLDGERKIRQK